MGQRAGALEAVELSGPGAGPPRDESVTGHSVLVTGAYGLLGSWLVKELLARAARVSVIRRDQRALSALESMALDRQVNVIDGDICADGLVLRTLAEYEVDSVFHLAAQTLVPTANHSPLGTFETNIRGTWTVLEACRLHGAERVIVASSDKAYGAQNRLPYREEFALEARYPYDVSKAATDLIARSYWHTWRLPVAVTRFANLYGGGDVNGSRLVPEAVTAALAGRRPVVRSDGSPERDFLYVEDAVRAYLDIWRALGGDGSGLAGAAGEAFNAGGGRPHRVGDLVGLICRLAGTGVEPDVRGRGTPRGEIDRQWVDYSKLNGLTGWEPRVGLEEGLRRTIEWYREHPEWVELRPPRALRLKQCRAGHELVAQAGRGVNQCLSSVRHLEMHGHEERPADRQGGTSESLRELRNTLAKQDLDHPFRLRHGARLVMAEAEAAGVARALGNIDHQELRGLSLGDLTPGRGDPLRFGGGSRPNCARPCRRQEGDR